MTIYILVFVEPDGIRTDRKYMDMLCAMYGYQLEYIDKTGDMDQRSGNVRSTLDQAWADSKFSGYTWVYFDGTYGTINLHDYRHPRDNVVYVIGSDFDGYNRSLVELNGDILKLKTKNDSTDLHAAGVVAAIVNHRYYQLERI